MISKLKNAAYGASASAMALAPALAHARYTRPQDNYGLATDQDFAGLITTILGWFLSFLAVLAILMIVVSGVLYLTSGGDEDRIARAKSWLTYAIIGLVVALLGYVIVYAVSEALNAG